MRITVAIVTRNRCQQLAHCLKALTRQTARPWQVLVIDNASTDQTKETVLSFRNKLPIRYLVEKKIGIPYARNRALSTAKGHLLAFTDDDCQPTTTWLEKMEDAHRRYRRAVAVQGQSIGKSLSRLLGLISHLFHQATIKKNLVNGHNLLHLDTKNVSLKLQFINKHKLRFNLNLSRGSDAYFGKQILGKNGQIIFYPQARIFFWPRENFYQFLVQRYRWARANTRITFDWPKTYFPNTPNQLSLVNHRLVHRYWYKLPLVFLVTFSAKVVEKIGHSLAKREIQYQNLGYGTDLNNQQPPSRTFKTISVAIITKDRSKLIKRCLKSLLTGTRPNQVIVIDSSSNNQTQKAANSFASQLNLIYCRQERLGRGVARNKAIAQAKSDIIAFIDDDLEVTPNWLEQMLIAHNLYPNLIAIQGRILSQPTTPWALVEQFRLDRWFIEKTNKRGFIEILTTKNVSFKRKMLWKMHLKFAQHLDPDFADLIGEDVDFAKQILALGQKIKYFPQALVYHWERPTLDKFLSQQYRKGFSYGLVKKFWPQYYPHLTKSPTSFVKSRFVWPVLEMFFHPVLRHHLAKLVLVLPLYYLSVLVYFKGYLDSLKNKLQYHYIPTSLKTRPTLPQITLAVATHNRSDSLKRLLYSLCRQQALPREILIVDNASTDNTEEIVNIFKPHLPISYLVEKQIGVAFARNKALKEVRTPLIVFTDDDCEVPSDWLSQVDIAHQQYPAAAAIQGSTESQPKGHVLSIITRFNRQTWIRNNMTTGRHLYWDLVQGKIAKPIPLLVCDTRNASFKMPILDKFQIRFDENLQSKGDDYDLAKQLLHHKQTIIFYPKIKVFHHERTKLSDFLKTRFSQGQASGYLFSKWPRKYFPQDRKKNFWQKLAAFLYFSFANNYFLQLPTLAVLFVLSELAYRQGKNRQNFPLLMTPRLSSD